MPPTDASGGGANFMVRGVIAMLAAGITAIVVTTLTADKIDLNGTSAPSASAAGDARIYYNNTDDKLYLSKNGGGFSELGAGGGGSLPVTDTTSIVEGSADNTKEIRFEVDGLTTGTVRVITPPNSNFTMAGINIAQTFTAKQTFSSAVITTPVVLTDGANIATDASLGNYFRVTLAGNRQLDNPSNATDGQKITWEIIQDGTGSRTITLDTKFAFGTTLTSVTLTTTASKKDFLSVIYHASADKFYVVGFVKGF